MPVSVRRRIFVAVWPDEEVVRAVSHAVDKARLSVSDDPATASAFRWLKREAWHLTVVFVGSVDSPGLEDVKSATEVAARLHEPFEIAVSGAGAFPGIRNPRVLWVGIHSEGKAFEALAREVRASVARVVPLKRESEHIPHLTVARVRRRVDVGTVVEALAEAPHAAMTVSRVALVESILDPSGATYTTLEEFSLGT